MSAYPVSFACETVRDLDAIYDYIAKDSPGVAETLSHHPYAGKQANDLQQGLRTFTVSSYRVLYSVPNKSVMIKRLFMARVMRVY